MDNQEKKNITCKKIAWTITNFSSLKTNAKHYSGDFTLGNCAWRLKIYRGRRKTNAKSLSIYLKVADALSFSQGWSILAAFSLKEFGRKLFHWDHHSSPNILEPLPIELDPPSENYQGEEPVLKRAS